MYVYEYVNTKVNDNNDFTFANEQTESYITSESLARPKFTARLNIERLS